MCGVEMWKAEINLCCLDIISGLTIFFWLRGMSHACQILSTSLIMLFQRSAEKSTFLWLVTVLGENIILS